MQRQLNILWQKEPNTNLYVDIFAVPSNPINFEHHEKLVDLAYEGIKIPQYRSNELLAAFARHQGEEKLLQGNYLESLKKANLCLALATKATSDAGVAYAGRSKSFFHLKLYRECLLDIEMAKQSYQSKGRLRELNVRAADCQKFMHNEQHMSELFTADAPKLSFDENANFAGVANCLRIVRNEKFGRHIVTTCNIEVGQTILVENPFTIVPTGEFKGRNRCNNCFKDCMNFITCDNCIEAFFCNTNCMEKSFHRYECNRPNNLSKRPTFGLVLRMFRKINAIFADVNAMIAAIDLLLKGQKLSFLANKTQKEFGMIFQLTHNHEKKPEDELKRLRTATVVALSTILRDPALKRKFAMLNYRRFLQHLIFHLFHVAENAIDLLEYHQTSCKDPIGKYSLEEYATAMYPFACYINHSCIPNVCCFFIDGRFICKAIRPIKKGKQVLRSYIPITSYADATLKVEMEKQYHFKCECSACLAHRLYGNLRQWNRDDIDLNVNKLTVQHV